jgi:uncharacterized membrane protein
MSATQQATSGIPTQQQRRSEPQSDGWLGWIGFAGIMMVLVGTFTVIDGLAALFSDDFFVVTKNDLLVSVSFTTWGWVHLILGIIVVAAGYGVIAGQTWARVVGIFLAMISAVVNLAFMAAYPVWSVILITLDVIVIYALAVHGREART